MATTITGTMQPPVLTVSLEDASMLKSVKQAIKLLRGVTAVKVQKVPKKKEMDITKTAGFREAMDDVKHGRVYHYDSLQDFYKEMGL